MQSVKLPDAQHSGFQLVSNDNETFDTWQEYLTKEVVKVYSFR